MEKLKSIPQSLINCLKVIREYGCSTYGKYKPEIRYYTLRQIECAGGIFERTQIDYSVQRKGGKYREGGWSDEDFHQHFKTVMNQEAEMNRILVADMQSSYHAKKDNCPNSKKYYYEKMGVEIDQEGNPIVDNDGDYQRRYDFLSGDGNNTTDYYVHFVRGEQNVEWEGAHYFFKDLPEEWQDVILNHIQFEYTVLYDVSSKEFTKLFRNRNGGLPPTPQQCRQSSLSDHANKARELVKKFDNLVSRSYSRSSQDQLDPDAQIATWYQLLASFLKGQYLTVNDSMLDKQYADFEVKEHEHAKERATIYRKIKDLYEKVGGAYEALLEKEDAGKKKKLVQQGHVWIAMWLFFGVDYLSRFKISDC